MTTPQTAKMGDDGAGKGGGQGPSTLASLHPAQPKEMRHRAYKSSTRLHGSHTMMLRRASRLPESGREYRSGDPVNMIDWKAYARTDQLVVREIRDEATARVRIGVDIGETMAWPDVAVPVSPLPPTKVEVALRVAMNLAHMHLRMGDLVEISLFEDGGKGRGVKPRSPVDLVTAFDRMVAAQFAMQAVGAEVQSLELDERMCDATFWIGDALGSADSAAFLGRGKRRALLHVLSSLELDIDWVEGDTSYFDEGVAARERKEYQGQVLKHRRNYLQSLEAWRQRLAKDLTKEGGVYLALSDKTPIAEYQALLVDFLKLPA